MAKTTSVFFSGEARTLSNEEFDASSTSRSKVRKGLTKGRDFLNFNDENQRLNDALGVGSKVCLCGKCIGLGREHEVKAKFS